MKNVKPWLKKYLRFVESYRDPSGIKVQFEDLISIVPRDKTKMLTKRVENNTKFMKQLQFIENTTKNNGKWLFDRNIFVNLDFTSLHCEFISNLLST